MKKYRIIPIIIFALFLGGCDEDSFTSIRFQPEPSQIDSIYLSTGANKLIADGHAKLQFIVETFRTATFTKSTGETFDSLVFVNYKDLPSGSLKIYDENNNEVDMEYFTDDDTPDTMGFYAKVGDVESVTKTVELREQKTVKEKRYIDVIFHVFELDPNDDAYDKLSYQELKSEQLEIAIKDLNEVMNRELSSGANSASANIEFRLATQHKDGFLMGTPGYNKIIYDRNIIGPPAYPWYPKRTYYDSRDFSTAIEDVNQIWNPENYFNIVVMAAGANDYMGNASPKYQVIDTDPLPEMPGMGTVMPSGFIPETNFENVCLGIPRTLFFPGPNRRISICPSVGKYYGVLSTRVSNADKIDYCGDTQLYVGTDQWDDIVKTGVDGEKFFANNAMDDVRYPSLRNTFTRDQVERIRYAIDHCPSRMNSKTE